VGSLSIHVRWFRARVASRNGHAVPGRAHELSAYAEHTATLRVVNEELRELLEQLEQTWRALGVPTDRVLQPGLRSDEARALLLDDLDVAPESLVTWFSWHNGASEGWQAAPVSGELLGLRRCLETRQEQLVIGGDDQEITPWDAAWLPLQNDPAMYAVDTTNRGSVARGLVGRALR
jgi:hypothetical protein